MCTRERQRQNEEQNEKRGSVTRMVVPGFRTAFLGSITLCDFKILWKSVD